MLKYQRKAATAIFGLIILASIGCQRNTSEIDPQRLAEARAQYVLAAEPVGVEGVLDVQESYESPRDVVLVGKIGGVDNPWTKGRATFVLADPSVIAEKGEEDGEHICDDAACKFCAQKKAEKLKEGIAIVSFLDSDGEILSLDAQSLFGLNENQTVVVRGRAELDALGCLVVSAVGLYVRR